MTFSITTKSGSGCYVVGLGQIEPPLCPPFTEPPCQGAVGGYVLKQIPKTANFQVVAEDGKIAKLREGVKDWSLLLATQAGHGGCVRVVSVRDSAT